MMIGLLAGAAAALAWWHYGQKNQAGARVRVRSRCAGRRKR